MTVKELLSGMGSTLMRRREKQADEYRRLVRGVADEDKSLSPEKVIDKLESTGRSDVDLVEDVLLLQHRREWAEVAFEEDRWRTELDRLKVEHHEMVHVRHLQERQQLRARQIADNQAMQGALSEAERNLAAAIQAKQLLESTSNELIAALESPI